MTGKRIRGGASAPCHNCRKIKRCHYYDRGTMAPALICRPCARKLGYTQRKPEPAS